MRRFKVKFQRLQHIFISHLHGDHYLGLFGLLGSMGLTGRTQTLRIYGPPELEELLNLQKKVSKVHLAYDIEFIPLVSESKELLYEDKVLKIYSFPVKHRLPTWGFSFEEKEKRHNLKADKIKEYSISIPEIQDLLSGEKLERDGRVIPTKELFDPPPPPVKYAYCADTVYNEEIIPFIEGADLLYHEATFAEKDSGRAISTMHSTAKQAATIALKSNSKKLLLGHFSARYRDTGVLESEAKEIFQNVVCVEDGDEFLL